LLYIWNSNNNFVDLPGVAVSRFKKGKLMKTYTLKEAAALAGCCYMTAQKNCQNITENDVGGKDIFIKDRHYFITEKGVTILKNNIKPRGRQPKTEKQYKTRQAKTTTKTLYKNGRKG
jgi:hypothetical protein